MFLSLPRTATALAVGLVVALTTAAAPASAGGAAWRDISPPESDGAVLFDVETAGGATWAVGLRNDATTRSFAPVALRWTGTGWEAPAQPVERARLDDLAVGAPDQVWAVGSQEEEGATPGRCSSTGTDPRGARPSCRSRTARTGRPCRRSTWTRTGRCG